MQIIHVTYPTRQDQASFYYYIVEIMMKFCLLIPRLIERVLGSRNDPLHLPTGHLLVILSVRKIHIQEISPYVQILFPIKGLPLKERILAPSESKFFHFKGKHNILKVQ